MRASERDRQTEKEIRERKDTRRVSFFFLFFLFFLYIIERRTTLSHREKNKEKDMFVVHRSGLLGEKRKANDVTHNGPARRPFGSRGCLWNESLVEETIVRAPPRTANSAPPCPRCKSATLRHCKIIGVLITQFSTK